MGIVEGALADAGPLTGPELAERVAAEGIPHQGQATPHLLGWPRCAGVTVLGPGEAFVLTRDWIGEPTAVDRDDRARGAGAALPGRPRARDGGGPRAWSGLPLRDARAGLRSIDVWRTGICWTCRAASPRRPISRRPLGAFDPYLLGWKDRRSPCRRSTPSACTREAGSCAPWRCWTEERSARGRPPA